MPERQGSGELGLRELIAMGVGGMIGGGIFSVLGLAVDESGHAAPLAFLVGSLIAVGAGYSYVRLALAYRSDGASFTYLETAFPKRLAIAAIAGRTVVVGYIGTLALYAFTFGAYGAHLLGWEHVPAVSHGLSVGVLVAFMIINLWGAREMGVAEDIIVYTKILLLATFALVGLFSVRLDHFTPLFSRGVPSVFLGGALIFVAYEGFQLITNAVCETRNPERNVPLGVYGAIAVTSAIYIAIAVVAVGTLEPAVLRAANEYALAVIARPVLGRIGVVAVDIAALLATSSAINATLFGAARMAAVMASDDLAPKAFSFRNRNDAPVLGIIAVTALAAVFAVTGGLGVIAAFSSMTFLLVSIGVSLANLKLWRETRSRPAFVLSGLALMLATVILLVVYMVKQDPTALLVTIGIYGAAAMTYGVFVLFRRRATRHLSSCGPASHGDAHSGSHKCDP